MRIQQKIDDTLDPFFAKNGSKWLTLTSFTIAVVFPLAQLATVTLGTRALSNGGFEINSFYMVPIWIIVFSSLFGRYTRRFERAKQSQFLIATCISLVACLLILVLSLPHMPLAHYLHVSGAYLGVLIQLPILAGLVAGLIATLYAARNHKSSAFKV